MTTKTVIVKNKLGLHARVAGKLVQCLQGFSCAAFAVKGENRRSLKSIMDVMLLGCRCGDTLVLEFDGPDERQAAETVETLFENQFGEKNEE